MDFYDLLFLLLICWLAFMFYRSITVNRRQAEKTAAAKTASAAQKTQMVEDIKATQTSRISDAIEILDELGGSAGGYRHYCELVGTAMRENGVTAPYSGRQVAYYDVKCYRIDHVNGVDRETLVAHEKSIDPFCFYDDSCETPVYVDIASFGNNVILVNSTNHIEGPNSDFSKAFNSNTASGGASTTGGTAYAFAASPVEAMGNMLAQRVADVARALHQVLRPGMVASPQLAIAGATGGSVALQDAPKNVMFSQGHGPGGMPKSHGSGYGYGGFGQMPRGMRDFMGGYGGVYNIPVRTYRRSSDMGDVLVGMTLSALLRSLNTASTQTTVQTAPPTPTQQFQGYRIVEDVVPLGSPTYCIGEMYRHGTDIYMGKSTSKDYSTSYFACRPEAEVLTALGA